MYIFFILFFFLFFLLLFENNRRCILWHVIYDVTIRGTSKKPLMILSSSRRSPLKYRNAEYPYRLSVCIPFLWSSPRATFHRTITQKKKKKIEFEIWRWNEQRKKRCSRLEFNFFFIRSRQSICDKSLFILCVCGDRLMVADRVSGRFIGVAVGSRDSRDVYVWLTENTYTYYKIYVVAFWIVNQTD